MLMKFQPFLCHMVYKLALNSMSALHCLCHILYAEQYSIEESRNTCMRYLLTGTCTSNKFDYKRKNQLH